MSTVSATPQPEVVLDITRLIGRFYDGKLPTGVDRVSLAYVAHFYDRARAKLHWRALNGLYSRNASKQIFDLLLRWNLDEIPRLKRLVLWGALASVGNANLRGLWLFNTGHNGLEHARYERDVRWHQLRPLFFIHDLIPITHPEFCRAQEAQKHAARINNMIAWGKGLIVNSRTTAQELRSYAEQNNLKLPPLLIAPLASSVTSLASAEVSEANNLQAISSPPSQNYFLVLGTVEPRKNLSLLLDVWRTLLEKFGDATPSLIVIGQAGWETQSVMDALSHSATWQGKLQWHKACSDAELSRWMKGARALLFPSFIEGYGLPVVEALLAGVPVIASDLLVIREIAADVPMLLNPRDASAWIEVIEDYSRPNSAARQAQLQRMPTLSHMTWAHHFELVDDFCRP
ncbi:MAG: glycosyltransferase family 4 protein [Brachymonas sp.]|nr:glycosyltransferase family 4 protein [Brachymonas sp.]